MSIRLSDSTHFRVIPPDAAPDYGEMHRAAAAAAAASPTPSHGRGLAATATAGEEEEAGGRTVPVERPVVPGVGMESETGEETGAELSAGELRAGALAASVVLETDIITAHPLPKTDSPSKKKGNKSIVIILPKLSILSC